MAGGGNAFEYVSLPTTGHQLRGKDPELDADTLVRGVVGPDLNDRTDGASLGPVLRLARARAVRRRGR